MGGRIQLVNWITAGKYTYWAQGIALSWKELILTEFCTREPRLGNFFKFSSSNNRLVGVPFSREDIMISGSKPLVRA